MAIFFHIAFLLESINVERLIRNSYADIVQDKAVDICNAIQAKIQTYTMSKEESEAIVQQQIEAMQKVEAEQESCIDEARRKTSRTYTRRIISRTIERLTRSAGEIARVCKSRGQDGAKTLIDDIVRNSLTDEIKHTMGDVIESIASRIDTALSIHYVDTSTSNAASAISSVASVALNEEALGKGAKVVLGKTAKSLIASGGIGATIGSALKFALPVLNPIVAALAAVIPAIISFFFGESDRKRKEKEALREIEDIVRGEVIPQVRGELEKQIPQILEEQVEATIKEIATLYKDKLMQQKQAIESAQKEMERKHADIESMVAICKEALDSIQKAAQKIFK